MTDKTVGQKIDAAADSAKAAGKAVKEKVEEVGHKAQAGADKEIAKDPDMPLTERLKAGADYVKQKAQEMASSVTKEGEKEKASLEKERAKDQL